jgi:GT2 family glycosyltransferase
MTVHNRVELTLACLRSLAAQHDAAGADVTTYLLDDGSTDGTADRVAREHPDVVVLHGDGSFFWNGGMRVAMARARHDDPDHYLWLNDDTTLRPGALRQLLDTAEGAGAPSAPVIVCGAVVDPETVRLSYSGVVRHGIRPMRFDGVAPTGRPEPVETMNGNCVLLSREVVRRVGNLDPTFRHAMGDYDYGLRARRAGATIWLAPDVLAECRANPGFVAGGGTLREELARFRSTKHLPPSEWAHFTRAWAGPAWPLAWAFPYLRRTARLLRDRLTAARAGWTRR